MLENNTKASTGDRVPRTHDQMLGLNLFMESKEIIEGLWELYLKHGIGVYQLFISLTLAQGWDNQTAYFKTHNTYETTRNS